MYSAVRFDFWLHSPRPAQDFKSRDEEREEFELVAKFISQSRTEVTEIHPEYGTKKCTLYPHKYLPKKSFINRCRVEHVFDAWRLPMPATFMGFVYCILFPYSEKTFGLVQVQRPVPGNYTGQMTSKLFLASSIELIYLYREANHSWSLATGSKIKVVDGNDHGCWSIPYLPKLDPLSAFERGSVDQSLLEDLLDKVYFLDGKVQIISLKNGAWLARQEQGNFHLCYCLAAAVITSCGDGCGRNKDFARKFRDYQFECFLEGTHGTFVCLNPP